MDRKAEIFQFIKDNQAEAIDLLRTIGRIPSPSRHEEKRAEFLQNWFHENGYPQAFIDEAKNVCVEINMEHAEDIVVCMAHIDVVFEDTEPLPMSEENNTLHAPGIGDDTGNLVCLLMMSRWLLQNKDRINTGILLVADACEEGLGNLDGCKEIMRRYGSRIKYFYSLDGNKGGCVNGAVGSHRYEVRIHTKGGHSYADFGNDNAIHVAARIIGKLYEIEPPQETVTTFNVGKITGGSTINSIAQEAVFLYEYRSENENCLAAMKEKMNAVIREFIDEGKDVQVKVLGIRPGTGEMDREAFDAWTEKNIEAVNRYFCVPMKKKASSTDANIPLSKGIFANTVGAIIGHGAHTREEWIELDSIPEGIGIAIALIEQYLK